MRTITLNIILSGNSEPGMVDYMIWPWFEQFPLIKLYYPSIFDVEAAKAQNPSLVSELSSDAGWSARLVGFALKN